MKKPLLALALVLGWTSLCFSQGSFVNWETPHVYPLDLTPDHAQLLAVNLPDNRLEVFDLTSGSPVRLRSIPVGLDPVTVRARTDTEAWVVNHVSDSVSVVDLDGGHVIATLQTGDEPADVVFTGTPTLAFVSCSQENTVLVFDPADLQQPPVRISIAGEDPREMAVSPDGQRVYVAIFESGNETTIIGSGGVVPGDFPPNIVGNGQSPYQGQNPPPNSGPGFDPEMSAGLPAAPGVAQIVRLDDQDRWVDDNGGDWTEFVSGSQSHFTGRRQGWRLSDHDVAILDLTTQQVTYADHLMNLCMALAVNPASGALSVVGTDATNWVRFEPNVSGRFLRVLLGLVDPADPIQAELVDLNLHLDYAGATIEQAERERSLSDPRGIAWNAAGTRAYVTGMGTDNVVVLDADGARAGLASTIEVGAGPTGIVIDESRGRLYVMNKFEASISVVSTSTELELARVPFFDPTPPAIRAGRPHLYDAHETSGLGLTACASCHVDARIDRLAWDLGDPSGEMQSSADVNRGAGIPGLSTGHIDFHPMKGPMLTQTLQDIVGKEPFHWRGDRTGLEEFNEAFESLMGDDEQLSAGEMQEFEDFLATIYFPPNPYRNLDDSLPTNLGLFGYYSPGRFSPAGSPLPSGNAVRGKELYRVGSGIACASCHTLPMGMGTNTLWNGSSFEPLPPGPMGEDHHAIHPPVFLLSQELKIPHLRNLYERTGFDGTQLENRAGFGYRHDGAIDSLPRFVARPHFEVQSDQDIADLVAFLLTISGGIEPEGNNTTLSEPPGSASQSTPAVVGKQFTLAGPVPPPISAALLDLFVLQAERQVSGLVVRGRHQGLIRGWFYAGDQRFQSDRGNERLSRAALVASAGPGAELTFTAVPFGSEVRIGVDRDLDGAYDRDEIDAGKDPANPHSRPRARLR